jgi:cell division protein FtsI/penicillin-binding protein 2
MTEALEKSDNTAMIYITDLLGSQRFRDYLRRFAIGQPLALEVEEDVQANFPEVWGPVETATRSFGQGISLTSLQLLRAVGAIANGGAMMKPYLVERAVDKATGVEYETKPQVLGQAISAETARIVSKMMQAAAQHGEAQYIYKNTQLIAGKTGTAQIPIAGGYEDETIASFVGFAPYDNPEFAMLVKFERPQSSPWAAETAALTWNELAQKLFVIFGIN